MTKRLLIVANDFPPIGGAGVQRSLYFAKYLPSFGWEPTVLTVKEVVFPTKDSTLLDELPPEVRVVRTESLEFRRLLWFWQRFISKRFLRKGRRADELTEVAAAGMSWQRLLRCVRRWLFVPDDRVLWAPFAVWRALDLVRRGSIQAVYATVPCYSSGLIGYLVSVLTGLPLVVDLRDPWTADPYLPSPTPVHAWLNGRLEALAVRRAVRVIVISETMAARFRQSYSDLPPKRIEVITNGFDTRMISEVTPVGRRGRFVFAYVGSLYAHHRRVLRAFCEGWNRAADRTPGLRSMSTIWLVGRCEDEIREELSNWGQVPFEILGYRSHAEGLAHLKGASALLLLIKDLDPERDLVTIPGKLFEYLGVGSPILMIGPEGDAADIVRDGGGRVHAQDDVVGIAESLQDLYRASQSDNKTPPGLDVAGPLSRYERRALTGRLASALDAAVEGT